MVSDACPGIPNLVEEAYVNLPGRGIALDLSILRGPDELTTHRAYSPSGFPAIGDVLLFCGSGFEVLSIINTYCADVVLVVGGGLGSLMEGIIAVVNDLPVVCFSPSGGVAGEMQPLFERYRSRYKNLRITTCRTVSELDAVFAAFVRDFLRQGATSRLVGFLSRLHPKAGKTCLHTDILIDRDLGHVLYQCGQSKLEVQEPVLLIDDAQILKDISAGVAIRSVLDEAPREYHYDGITTRVPSGIPNLVWCPSIDTFLLIVAMRRHARNLQGRALDVGTGTGVIAMWLAASGKASNVVGIDVQAEATRCAAVNAAEAGLADRCQIRTARYHEFWKGGVRFDLIACNPPYIPLDDADREEEGSFFGMSLLIELLASFDQILTPVGECFVTLSSASWTDSAVKGLMQGLIDGGRATMIDERVVPFKLAAVLVDAPWLDRLIGGGGVFDLNGNDDYSYGHRVQVWRLVPAERRSGENVDEADVQCKVRRPTDASQDGKEIG